MLTTIMVSLLIDRAAAWRRKIFRLEEQHMSSTISRCLDPMIFRMEKERTSMYQISTVTSSDNL